MQFFLRYDTRRPAVLYLNRIEKRYRSLSQAQLDALDDQEFARQSRARLDEFEAGLASREQKQLLDLGWYKGIAENMTRETLNADQWHVDVDGQGLNYVQAEEKRMLDERNQYLIDLEHTGTDDLVRRSDIMGRLEQMKDRIEQLPGISEDVVAEFG